MSSNWGWVAAIGLALVARGGWAMGERAGQPANVASSAYLYRADRPMAANSPESTLLLVQRANLPYDRPIDLSAPAVKGVLCGLLWEEVRQVRRLELHWQGAGPIPAPEDLEVRCFDAGDAQAHTWWNPRTERVLAAPKVGPGGRTYAYAVPVDTWGITISMAGGKPAAGTPTPDLRAFGEERWKSTEIELEWGFRPGAERKDFSGGVTGYDAILTGLRPLSADKGTRATGLADWSSPGDAMPRRGVRFRALYIGSTAWRKVWPYLAQPEDSARSLVTVQTRSGSFTFNVADLEHGPIYAPAYGFFVRAATAIRSGRTVVQPRSTPPALNLMDEPAPSLPGVPRIRGWASQVLPWFGVNPDNQAEAAGSLAIPARCAAMHPSPDRDAAAAWTSPIKGEVRVSGHVAMADSAGGNGIEWYVALRSPRTWRVLAHGATTTGGAQDIGVPTPLAATVQPGEQIVLGISAKGGDHACDTTIVQLRIQAGGRQWSLPGDVLEGIATMQPRGRTAGIGPWRCAWLTPVALSTPAPHEPPIRMESAARTACEFVAELATRKLTTIRTRTQSHPEQTWQGAVEALHGPGPFPPTPQPAFLPAMRVELPEKRLEAQWNLGAWHILRRSLQSPDGTWRFNDFPFGILSSETYMILRTLDLLGMHKEAADGLDQWLKLPMEHHITPGQGGHHSLALPDRPLGHFSDGVGCLTHAEGIEGFGGHMDAVHAMGPGAIVFTISEHYRLTGDDAWLRANIQRITANAEWILRQRAVIRKALPGGDRLWSAGLQPAQVVTPDSMSMHMQFYETEAYYWMAVKRTAELLAVVDPEAGRKMADQAEEYRRDLVGSIDRSIMLTPVTAVRDGTYRSFIPFAPYVRGFAAGAWGWRRCQGHVGAIYWDTVQSADPLVSPAGLLAIDDPRVQGHLDVLEDRLLLENTKVVTRTPAFVADRDWFGHASWQYQCGLERHANIHLLAGDAPSFIRSIFNQYSVDILPGDYTFQEHTTGGPPDKSYEESCFLERVRHMLAWEEGDTLWIARATPREWLASGKRIAVTNAPTTFGDLSYSLASDLANSAIHAEVDIPGRCPASRVVVSLRTPTGHRMRSVTVNGETSTAFDPARETVTLTGLTGHVMVIVRYD